MGFVMTPNEILKFLEEQGFYHDREGRHTVMTNGTVSVPVPTSHSRDVHKGTASRILREAGFSTRQAKEWREGR